MRPLNQPFLLLLLLFLSQVCTAQEDCQCNGITDANRNSLNPDSLLKSAKPACKIQGYRIKARTLLIRRELDSAEVFINKALELLAGNHCREDDFLIFYQMLDNLYANRSDFKGAIAMELKIISIFENKKDSLSVCRGLLNVSNIFNEIKQSETGISYARKAIGILERLRPSSEKAVLLARASQRYFVLYESLGEKRYLDSTEYYAAKGQAVMKTQPVDKEATLTINNRLITVAIARKQFDKAQQFIDANLKLCDRSVDFPELHVTFTDKTNAFFAAGKNELAKIYADSALHYSKLLRSPAATAEAWQLLYKIAEASGNSDEALQAYKQERIIRDSIGTAEKLSAVTELEKKYNQAKNEKTIRELAQQKQIYLLFGLAGLLTAVIIGFFLRQQALKHKQKILETEQRLNRARMNPHFFFNALASLQSIAMRENDGEAMASNLSKFSHIMRETLESTYKEYVTLEQEISFLQEYLDVQKIRFPRKFEFHITADKTLETDELQLPSMIIQPFAENSIEHGFSNIDYTGQLNIHFSRSGKELQVQLTDNGKGLHSGEKTGGDHISRASQIIKDRIYLLNLKLKSRASFSIDNNKAGKGVIVKISLPLIYIDSTAT